MSQRAIYINNKPLKVSPADLIGEGGEAEVYKVDSNTALKLFKLPDHPTLAGSSQEAYALRSAARARILDAQAKLRAVPTALPDALVAPIDLAFDKTSTSRQIVGYTMRLIAGGRNLRDLAQKGIRQREGITDKDVLQIFLRLHQSLLQIHQAGVIVGDFNPFNVLIADNRTVHLIDMDSMQFNGFKCKVFSPRYIDPLICNAAGNQITMSAEPNALTDWYSFALMLFECLMFVHPYGGVYRSAKRSAKISQDLRPLKRISVFSEEVIYPLAAKPLSASLPSELLDYYKAVLHADKREEFPLEYLKHLHFANGRAYLARPGSIAPSGQASGRSSGMPSVSVPGARATTAMPGETGSAIIFQTEGTIFKVCHQTGRLRYVFHRDSKFCREHGVAFLSGKATQSMKFCISGDATLVSSGAQVFLLSPGEEPQRLSADLFRDLEPVFDANSSSHYWVGGGRLWCNSALGPRLIDDVLTNQTRIWTGESFGFGFYCAGNLKRSFLFDNRTHNKIPVVLPDHIKVPIAIQCHFVNDHLWLLLSTLQNAALTNHCCLIDRSGVVLAYQSAAETDDSWLNTLDAKCGAACVTADGLVIVLLAASDDGLTVIEAKGRSLVPSLVVPDSAGKIPARANLIYRDESLFFWTASQIGVLTGVGAVLKDGLNNNSNHSKQGVA